VHGKLKVAQECPFFFCENGELNSRPVGLHICFPAPPIHLFNCYGVIFVQSCSTNDCLICALVIGNKMTRIVQKK
jgi:hypothetical protein